MTDKATNKTDEELVTWFKKYVEYVNDIDKDFRSGIALLDFVESLSDAGYPRASPDTPEGRHKNVTIAFMAILQIYDGLDVNVSVDDIVEGNPEKTRNLLNLLASDEWEIVEEPEVAPKEPFNAETCDLTTYELNKVQTCQNAIRRYLDYQKVAKLTKQRKHRDAVVKEIVQTEEHYVKCLETLIEIYMKGLIWKAEVIKQPILSMEEIASIFSNVETILNFNETLLAKLQERLMSWSYKQCVADILLEMAPLLGVYTQYCNNYEFSIVAVEKAKKRSVFTAYLEECRAHLNVDTNHFNSLLITPIQRGPRYVLLLKELLSRTHPEHPDYENIKKAIVAVENQVTNVNKKIKESQALNAVIMIQSQLVGDDVPDLVSPSRYLLQESSFTLCTLDSKQGKEFETVYLALFNDSLLYCKKSHSSTLKFRNVIPLSRGTRVKDIPNMGVVRNAFNILSAEKTLTLMTHSEEHKKEWVALINKQLAEMVEISRSRSGSRIEHGSGGSGANPGGGEGDDAHGPPSPDRDHVSATITGTKTLSDASGHSFTCYSIDVTPAGNEEPYTVYRRYREFDSLWRTLRKKFPEKNMMPLPKKHYFGNLKKDIVESRQVMLETFLEDVLSKPDVCQSSEFVIFLLPSDNYKEAQSLKGKTTKLSQPDHLRQRELESKQAEKELKAKKRAKLKGSLLGSSKKKSSSSSLTQSDSVIRARSHTMDSSSLTGASFVRTTHEDLNLLSKLDRSHSHKPLVASSPQLHVPHAAPSPPDQQKALLDASLSETKTKFKRKPNKSVSSRSLTSSPVTEQPQPTPEPLTTDSGRGRSGSTATGVGNIFPVLPPVPINAKLRPTGIFTNNYEFVKTPSSGTLSTTVGSSGHNSAPNSASNSPVLGGTLPREYRSKKSRPALAEVSSSPQRDLATAKAVLAATPPLVGSTSSSPSAKLARSETAPLPPPVVLTLDEEESDSPASPGKRKKPRSKSKTGSTVSSSSKPSSRSKLSSSSKSSKDKPSKSSSDNDGSEHENSVEGTESDAPVSKPVANVGPSPGAELIAQDEDDKPAGDTGTLRRNKRSSLVVVVNTPVTKKYPTIAPPSLPPAPQP